MSTFADKKDVLNIFIKTTSCKLFINIRDCYVRFSPKTIICQLMYETIHYITNEILLKNYKYYLHLLNTKLNKEYLISSKKTRKLDTCSNFKAFSN